jgi:hypothetical protein
MFGFKKKKDKPNPFFKFPLEDDIEDQDKVKAMMEAAEKQILELKKTIKDGASPEDYEKLGTLLHAYSALLKIFNRMPEQT